jgi:predicted kinase
MTLTLIRGLSGSGKTTLANQLVLVSPERTAHYEADMFHINEKGLYQWSKDRLADGHEWCQDMTKAAMINRTPHIVVSNTFTQWKEMHPYIEMANSYGYQVRIIHVHTLLDDHQLSVRNVHGVSSGVIALQRNRWQD